MAQLLFFAAHILNFEFTCQSCTLIARFLQEIFPNRSRDTKTAWTWTKVCAINSFLPHNNLVTVAWLLLANGFWPAATVVNSLVNI